MRKRGVIRYKNKPKKAFIFHSYRGLRFDWTQCKKYEYKYCKDHIQHYDSLFLNTIKSRNLTIVI